MLHRLVSLAVTVALASASPAQVVTPAEHLGRALGADFELADWSEVAGYHQRLAETSPRVLCEVVGRTTEGRDFLLTTISSEENLARLDEIRALAARIADPRGATAEELETALDQGRPIVFVSLGMHSTETSPPQFGMELAYRLATSDEETYRAARERLVVNLIPCTNPDGLDHVVRWYRDTVGTPHEAASLLELYHYYAGHDNNRDWFALTQPETRIVTELLYRRWHPQVYWDVHEQGSDRERMFVPPFRDPLNPNLDPEIIAGIGALGARALFDMTREGLTGISTGVSYDMWWNGGNRNVPVRHNIVGLLTEAAAVDLATPKFLPVADLEAPRGLGSYAPSNRFPSPWPGGWWRLRHVIDYEHAFARSLLGSLVREPRRWLGGALSAAQRAVDSDGVAGARAPRAWILPSSNADRGATRRLAELLLLAGVELFRAPQAFQVDGRTWPARSIVIPRLQPYGAHVKDLFEVQRYPDGEPPYDVAGWTLPLLFGVHRVEVMQDVTAPLEPVVSAAAAVEGWDTPASPRDSDAWRAVIGALASGQPPAVGEGWPPLAAELPRIGVYSPWSGSMDEGWLRWVLDDFGLPFTSVKNEMLRAGHLASFLDVLVLPNLGARTLDDGRAPGSVPEAFARGLDPEGAVAIEEFVRGGGKLVAVGGAANWAIDLFELPLRDVTVGESSGEFACPGSVLRAVPVTAVSPDESELGDEPDEAHEPHEPDEPHEAHEPHEVPPAGRLTTGLAPSVAVFFSRGAAWRLVEGDELEELGHADAHPAEDVDLLLELAPTRVLSSGWIRAPEVVAGAAVWARARHGAGQVQLFGVSPHYRGWSQEAFALLFRALLVP